MSTYVIGDVQGCFDSLNGLLTRVRFDRTRDRLWLVGDLVNRGPKSLEVLRFLRDLGPSAICVLGNHDLHLLARYAGLRPAKEGDTLDAVLAAPEAADLIDWLAARPLLHRENDTVMVHAGLLPQWTIADAERIARDLGTEMTDATRRAKLFAGPRFPDDLRALTTMRTCDRSGRQCEHKGPPDAALPGCLPWFDHSHRRSKESLILFGHWSALGVRRGDGYVSLDSGCVWGGSLTAYRLEDGALFAEAAHESTRTGEPGTADS